MGGALTRVVASASSAMSAIDVTTSSSVDQSSRPSIESSMPVARAVGPSRNTRRLCPPMRAGTSPGASGLPMIGGAGGASSYFPPSFGSGALYVFVAS